MLIPAQEMSLSGQLNANTAACSAVQISQFVPIYLCT